MRPPPLRKRGRSEGDSDCSSGSPSACLEPRPGWLRPPSGRGACTHQSFSASPSRVLPLLGAHRDGSRSKWTVRTHLSRRAADHPLRGRPRRISERGGSLRVVLRASERRDAFAECVSVVLVLAVRVVESSAALRRRPAILPTLPGRVESRLPIGPPLRSVLRGDTLAEGVASVLVAPVRLVERRLARGRRAALLAAVLKPAKRGTMPSAPRGREAPTTPAICMLLAVPCARGRMRIERIGGRTALPGSDDRCRRHDDDRLLRRNRRTMATGKQVPRAGKGA